MKGSCEHSIAPSDFIKCWELLEWMSNYWLLKDAVPRSYSKGSKIILLTNEILVSKHKMYHMTSKEVTVLQLSFK